MASLNYDAYSSTRPNSRLSRNDIQSSSLSLFDLDSNRNTINNDMSQTPSQGTQNDQNSLNETPSQLLARWSVRDNHFLDSRNGILLAKNTILKADQYTKHTSLSSSSSLNVYGAPSFRTLMIRNSNISLTAQPTVNGIRAILNIVQSRHQLEFNNRTAPLPVRTVWVNTREEPLVYLALRPFVLRHQYAPRTNINDYQGISDRIDLVERKLKIDVRNEAKKYGNILIHDEDKDGNIIPYWFASSSLTHYHVLAPTHQSSSHTNTVTPSSSSSLHPHSHSKSQYSNNHIGKHTILSQYGNNNGESTYEFEYQLTQLDGTPEAALTFLHMIYTQKTTMRAFFYKQLEILDKKIKAANDMEAAQQQQQQQHVSSRRPPSAPSSPFVLASVHEDTERTALTPAESVPPQQQQQPQYNISQEALASPYAAMITSIDHELDRIEELQDMYNSQLLSSSSSSHIDNDDTNNDYYSNNMHHRHPVLMHHPSEPTLHTTPSPNIIQSQNNNNNNNTSANTTTTLLLDISTPSVSTTASGMSSPQNYTGGGGNSSSNNNNNQQLLMTPHPNGGIGPVSTPLGSFISSPSTSDDDNQQRLPSTVVLPPSGAGKPTAPIFPFPRPPRHRLNTPQNKHNLPQQHQPNRPGSLTSHHQHSRGFSTDISSSSSLSAYTSPYGSTTSMEVAPITAYHYEEPADISNSSVLTMQQVFGALKRDEGFDVSLIRVPLTSNSPPRFTDIDLLISSIAAPYHDKYAPPPVHPNNMDTPLVPRFLVEFVFNCQIGYGRSPLCAAICYLIQYFLNESAFPYTYQQQASVAYELGAQSNLTRGNIQSTSTTTDNDKSSSSIDNQSSTSGSGPNTSSSSSTDPESSSSSNFLPLSPPPMPFVAVHELVTYLPHGRKYNRLVDLVLYSTGFRTNLHTDLLQRAQEISSAQRDEGIESKTLVQLTRYLILICVCAYLHGITEVAREHTKQWIMQQKPHHQPQQLSSNNEPSTSSATAAAASYSHISVARRQYYYLQSFLSALKHVPFSSWLSHQTHITNILNTISIATVPPLKDKDDIVLYNTVSQRRGIFLRPYTFLRFEAVLPSSISYVSQSLYPLSINLPFQPCLRTPYFSTSLLAIGQLIGSHLAELMLRLAQLPVTRVLLYADTDIELLRQVIYDALYSVVKPSSSTPGEDSGSTSPSSSSLITALPDDALLQQLISQYIEQYINHLSSLDLGYLKVVGQYAHSLQCKQQLLQLNTPQSPLPSSLLDHVPSNVESDLILQNSRNHNDNKSINQRVLSYLSIPLSSIEYKSHLRARTQPYAPTVSGNPHIQDQIGQLLQTTHVEHDDEGTTIVTSSSSSSLPRHNKNNTIIGGAQGTATDVPSAAKHFIFNNNNNNNLSERDLELTLSTELNALRDLSPQSSNDTLQYYQNNPNNNTTTTAINNNDNNTINFLARANPLLTHRSSSKRLLWINLREEPLIYLNDLPLALRYSQWTGIVRQTGNEDNEQILIKEIVSEANMLKSIYYDTRTNANNTAVNTPHDSPQQSPHGSMHPSDNDDDDNNNNTNDDNHIELLNSSLLDTQTPQYNQSSGLPYTILSQESSISSSSYHDPSSSLSHHHHHIDTSTTDTTKLTLHHPESLPAASSSSSIVQASSPSPLARIPPISESENLPPLTGPLYALPIRHDGSQACLSATEFSFATSQSIFTSLSRTYPHVFNDKTCTYFRTPIQTHFTRMNTTPVANTGPSSVTATDPASWPFVQSLSALIPVLLDSLGHHRCLHIPAHVSHDQEHLYWSLMSAVQRVLTETDIKIPSSSSSSSLGIHNSNDSILPASPDVSMNSNSIPVPRQNNPSIFDTTTANNKKNNNINQSELYDIPSYVDVTPHTLGINLPHVAFSSFHGGRRSSLGLALASLILLNNRLLTIKDQIVTPDTSLNTSDSLTNTPLSSIASGPSSSTNNLRHGLPSSTKIHRMGGSLEPIDEPSSSSSVFPFKTRRTLAISSRRVDGTTPHHSPSDLSTTTSGGGPSGSTNTSSASLSVLPTPSQFTWPDSIRLGSSTPSQLPTSSNLATRLPEQTTTHEGTYQAIVHLNRMLAQVQSTYAHTDSDYNDIGTSYKHTHTTTNSINMTRRDSYTDIDENEHNDTTMTISQQHQSSLHNKSGLPSSIHTLAEEYRAQFNMEYFSPLPQTAPSTGTSRGGTSSSHNHHHTLTDRSLKDDVDWILDSCATSKSDNVRDIIGIIINAEQTSDHPDHNLTQSARALAIYALFLCAGAYLREIAFLRDVHAVSHWTTYQAWLHRNVPLLNKDHIDNNNNNSNNNSSSNTSSSSSPSSQPQQQHKTSISGSDADNILWKQTRLASIISHDPFPILHPISLPSFSEWLAEHKEICKLLHDIFINPGEALHLSSYRLPSATEAVRHGDVLTTNDILKSDAFAGIANTALGQLCPGVLNLRFAAPSHVAGVGIPTLNGLATLLRYITSVGTSHYNLATKPLRHSPVYYPRIPFPTLYQFRRALHYRVILWLNLREEPILFINNDPYVLRSSAAPFANISQTGITSQKVERMEAQLKREALREQSLLGHRICVHYENENAQLCSRYDPIGLYNSAFPLAQQNTVIDVVRTEIVPTIEAEKKNVLLLDTTPTATDGDISSVSPSVATTPQQHSHSTLLVNTTSGVGGLTSGVATPEMGIGGPSPISSTLTTPLSSLVDIQRLMTVTASAEDAQQDDESHHDDTTLNDDRSIQDDTAASYASSTHSTDSISSLSTLQQQQKACALLDAMGGPSPSVSIIKSRLLSHYLEPILTSKEAFDYCIARVQTEHYQLGLPIPTIIYCRTPVTDEQAPIPSTIDLIVSRIKDAIQRLPMINYTTKDHKQIRQGRDLSCLLCISNCQMGRGRTTTSMVICNMLLDALNYEYYYTEKIYAVDPAFSTTNPTQYIPLLSPPESTDVTISSNDTDTNSSSRTLTLEDIQAQQQLAAQAGNNTTTTAPSAEPILSSDDIARSKSRYQLLENGWYNVIRVLVAALPNGLLDKFYTDNIIDRCSSMQNLRIAITQTLRSLEDPATLAQRKHGIIERGNNYLVRYIVLICIGSYLYNGGALYDYNTHQGGNGMTFTQWLNTKPEIGHIIKSVNFAERQ